MNTRHTAAMKKAEIQGPVVNGVPTGQLMEVIDSVQQDAGNAQFQFRLNNHWMGGSINRSRVDDFHANGREDRHKQAMVLDADGPRVIAGNDTAPTPVEYVLHALAACLTTTMVNYASLQGILIESLESRLEGDIDVRGFFGISEDVRKGYKQVRVRMRVKSDASAGHLRELALYSPVYDIVSNSLPVELIVETI
jgi:uncharacterized OsmC-like protein